MSDLNYSSTVRPRAAGTGPIRAASPSGQLSPETLATLAEPKAAVGDQVSLDANKGTGELPAVFQELSPEEQNALSKLPAPVLQKVLTDSMVNVLGPDRSQIAKNLLKQTKALVPGKGLEMEPANAWKITDAAIVYDVVNNLSIADRGRLEGVNFRRVGSSRIHDEVQDRHAEGAADIEIEKGVGVLGKAGYKMAELFELWALTAPLGLMLRAWFPHAITEVRNREVEIGDAQATRMREVLVHEIGHQVQFGPQTDLAAIKEWGRLSGWQNPDGSPALGIDESGTMMGFDPGVRPKRADNFVYQDFTKDLTPQMVREAAADIADPALRSQFMNVVQVKRNLREAIKEVMGVDATGYSMTSPLEDYAESYRAYNLDPSLLAKQAPDKFLFLNASSRKYSPEQVVDLFKKAGVNPQPVLTRLMKEAELSQETLDKIVKVNGLSGGDVKQLGAQAKAALAEATASGAGEVPAFRQAFMQIQQKVASRDLTFVNTFTRDPQAALGAVWDQMSAPEQAQFTDPAARTSIIQKMQRGEMSYVSGATEGLKQIQVKALQNFGGRLIGQPEFLTQLQTDAAAALSAPGVLDDMPGTVKDAFADAAVVTNMAAFAKALATLLKGSDSLIGQGDLRKQVVDSLKAMNEESLAVALTLLRDNPEKAAKVFTGLETAGPSTHGPGGN